MDYNKVQDYFLAYAADGMAYEIAVIKTEGSFALLVMCGAPAAVENAFREFTE